jgi:hypothetical protein
MRQPDVPKQRKMAPTIVHWGRFTSLTFPQNDVPVASAQRCVLEEIISAGYYRCVDNDSFNVCTKCSRAPTPSKILSNRGKMRKMFFGTMF